MGNCSSAVQRGSFIHRHGRRFPTDDEDLCPYGPRSSSDKDEEERATLVRADVQENDKGVVPSDSGIESLGPSTDESPENNCKKCNQRSQKVSQAECRQCRHIALLGSPCRSEAETCCSCPSEPETCCPSEPETYCSCGPRSARLQAWHQNLVCKTHTNSPKFFRHSDIIEVKPTTFRKNKKRGFNRKSNISCKSSDSFDYAGAMLTSMDNAKSVISDIFGDDVSLQAPLAAFDSVDGQLDSVEVSRRERTLSQLEDLTQRICQCETHASSIGVLGNQSPSDPPADQSIRDARHSYLRDSPERKISCINGFTEDVLRMSFSRKGRYGGTANSTVSLGSRVSIDQVEVEALASVPVRSRVRTQSLRNSVSESEDSFVLAGVKASTDMMMTVVAGQEMVIMPVTAYQQLVDELHTLKSQLATLSDILQDNNNIEDGSPELK